MFSCVLNIYCYGMWRNMINPDALEAGPYPNYMLLLLRNKNYWDDS
jgi:hypothetical protein